MSAVDILLYSTVRQAQFQFSARTAKNQYENSKQIFPEKELRRHSPNFHIHVSVSDLYNPTINLSILLQECGPILGILKSLKDTWMWKVRLRPRNSQKE